MQFHHRGWVLRSVCFRFEQYISDRIAFSENAEEVAYLRGILEGLPYSSLLPRNQVKRRFYHHMSNLRSPKGRDEARIFKAWSEIVETYSKCALTHTLDKLVAIDGIAQAIRRNLKGGDKTYSHGLWARHFLHGALWKVSKPHDAIERTVFPSWS